MTELHWDTAADEAMTRLERDPALSDVCRRVERVVELLARDPTNVWLRRTRFTRPPVWCVTIVVDDHEDWILLWNDHPTSAGDVQVQYLGPASFA